MSSFIYNSVYLVLSILGNAVYSLDNYDKDSINRYKFDKQPFFLSILLLDFLTFSDTLKDVLKVKKKLFYFIFIFNLKLNLFYQQ